VRFSQKADEFHTMINMTNATDEMEIGRKK
jgi:hypothetical protein